MIDRIVLNIFLAVVFMVSLVNGALATVTPDDSLSRANSYLAQGQYFLALQETDSILRKAASKTLQSRAYGMKGTVLLHLQRYSEAEESLLQAFNLAENIQHKAGYANSLGVLYHEMRDKTKLEQYFTTALTLAGNDSILALQIKLNQLRAQSRRIELPLLNELLTQIAAVDSPEERVRYYLNLASIAKSHSQQARTVVQAALEKTQADSVQIINNPLRVELLDSLAELYEIQGNDQQALELSEQASAMSGKMDADDLLINIEWRKGRIYQRQGRDPDALTAFRKAVDYIQTIRRDIPITYENGKSSFREKLEPIYLGYAHHLLKRSGFQEGEAKQRSLLLARQAIEQIKQTELEDYLGGRCMFEGVMYNELGSMDMQAAILYPIILPDRLELLVGIGKEIRQYTIPVSEDRIREAAFAISNSLRIRPSERKESYQRPSEDLYQWIIAPIEKILIEETIKTLVVVPDGVLRLVPFAALFDGKQFLVEKYAISISPGMSLLSNNKDAQKPREYRMLFAGLKTPGPVVEKLLKQRIDAEYISKYPESFDDLIKGEQEKLRLPQVETELNNLKNNNAIKNKILLNEQFTVESFNQQIEGQSYEIIHIASHGVFSSDVNSSYLMAYDDILQLDDLRKLLKRDKDAQGSIQLLTLSACETAEGDDRAPLGFTGAALKAEALSALGSLWPISDKAAAQLMASFYKHLTQHRGKAESLRQAQLELLKDPDMRDPFYWAPFILVGSWL